MCDCRTKIQAGIKEKHGIDGRLAFELMSGKTYTDLYYKKPNSRGKEVERTMSVLHSYCPFCGEKYAD
jgi:hypothetical protein